MSATDNGIGATKSTWHVVNNTMVWKYLLCISLAAGLEFLAIDLKIDRLADCDPFSCYRVR